MTRMQYIRNYYGVPAKLGMEVITCRGRGKIVGTCDARLLVCVGGETRNFHPTWCMTYIVDGKKVCFDTQDCTVDDLR